ncbi:hypothetical protein M413DRAFT_448932 [Hebeloma cylindrosporum]|uniref:Uncharacterized protein n=1 Tax=Hebeloma cylindrosporum TaxID=76867 RepID=A0A0C3BJA0_HEBCY|nr:hypothetical protein M413DRAFT_448932 [Hebeloma cylindrosporum h7]
MGQYWGFVNIDKFRSSGFHEEPSNRSRYVREVAGTWAGDRVICLGDYARSWPDGVVIENFSLENCKVAPEERSQWDQQQLYRESCTKYGQLDYGLKPAISYPNDRIWALRNITKKLYVRSDGIPTIDDKNNLTYYEHNGLQSLPGFGQVLLTNILWSDDDSTAMEFSDVRGSWAGDKLDIRLFDDVAEEFREGGWKDISRQEAIKLYNILLEKSDIEGDLPKEAQEHF